MIIETAYPEDFQEALLIIDSRDKMIEYLKDMIDGLKATIDSLESDLREEHD